MNRAESLHGSNSDGKFETAFTAFVFATDILLLVDDLDMDTDEGHTQQPSSPRTPNLQPTNTLAGPSTIPDPPAIFLPPPPAYPVQRPYFNSTQDLLARFHLSATYDKYVRPYSLPVDGTQPAAATPGAVDKGKGKEKEIPVFNTASPAAETPGAGGDGDDEDNQGKTKKWKNNYKHLIRGIPGKLITKKDDYLMTTMQVPPKQRMAIRPFDLRTQRDAFSVSLEGIAKWNVGQLVGDSPQAKEEKRRKKELRKLAKAQAQGILPPGMGTPGPSAQVATPTPSAAAGTPSTLVQQAAPARTGTPRPVASSARPPISTPAPVGGGPPRPGPTSSSAQPPPIAQTQPQLAPATPAPTPGAAPPAEPKRSSVKRERENSVVVQAEPMIQGGISINTNGMKPGMILNSKAATTGVRPRPVKKQRMDMQGHAREMPIQQPTPHA